MDYKIGIKIPHPHWNILLPGVPRAPLIPLHQAGIPSHGLAIASLATELAIDRSNRDYCTSVTGQRMVLKLDT